MLATDRLAPSAGRRLAGFRAIPGAVVPTVILLFFAAFTGAVQAEAQWEENGQRLYDRHCAACHQADGAGRPQVFPPLAGHAPDLVRADGGRDYLIQVILYGLSGEITVDGNRYRSFMPTFPRLSDEDIAAAANHILHAWGNEAELPADFEPITPEEVAGHRDRRLAPADMFERRPDID